MNRAAFTLVELLVVVAVLAIVAGGLLVAYRGVEEDAKERISQAEILEVTKALRAFASDTGSCPTQGPFALEPDRGRVPVPAQGRSWFLSPANLVQLYEEPLDSRGQPVLPWKIDTGRGWRGPYLRRLGEGYVDIGDSLATGGSGSPAAGSALARVPAAADPFEAPSAPPFFVWRREQSGPALPRFGRPYLVFDLADRSRSRVVSLGPNGVYESADPTNPGDDIVAYPFR